MTKTKRLEIVIVNIRREEKENFKSVDKKSINLLKHEKQRKKIKERIASQTNFTFNNLNPLKPLSGWAKSEWIHERHNFGVGWLLRVIVAIKLEEVDKVLEEEKDKS